MSDNLEQQRYEFQKRLRNGITFETNSGSEDYLQSLLRDVLAEVAKHECKYVLAGFTCMTITPEAGVEPCIVCIARKVKGK